MIFTHNLYDLWFAAEKTVTRRPCVSKSGRKFNPPQRGDLLPMQRGYVKPGAFARVLSVERQDGFFPDPADDAEAHREGFTDGWAFHEAWRAIYGDVPVDVYRIALGGPEWPVSPEDK